MAFVAITVEGGLFPADLLDKLATTPEEVQGQKPADFGLSGGRVSEETQSGFSAACAYWTALQHRLAAGKGSTTTITRDAFVLPLLIGLGYELEYQRAAAQVGGANFAISHRAGIDDDAPPAHIVAADQPLDERGAARLSPHALMQELLNRTDALWGIVTNGRRLRLLRDSARLARPTYLEVDLQAMLEGDLYNEFVVFYRLAHRSRLPVGSADAHACLLERWYQQGIEDGGRVREHLRDGVERALIGLGTGFLAHPANDELRQAVEEKRPDDLGFYRQLLRLIYRLLFLMVAEERKLLLIPSAEAAARQDIYTRWYSLARLRDRAEQHHFDDPHHDLWEGLKQTFRLFRDGATAAQLNLSPLDGELFAVNACFNLERATLANTALLEALFALSTFEETIGRGRKRGIRRRVNYAALDVEELGSVYESLLDYHPHIACDPPRFELLKGSERKTTGSYYTPPVLVQELIKSALVPVVEERLKAAESKKDKERALLRLKVIDPAAGSGHFLLAAARRIGRALAKVRTGEEEPAPAAYREAVRDVIRHCVYAVDKNPLAVDLCKVALWTEGHAAGLPLSFLDHHVKCGDSLIGVFDLKVLADGIPDEAYKPLTGDDKDVAKEARKRNRSEWQKSLFKFTAEEDLKALAGEYAALAGLAERTPDEVQAKEQLYRSLREVESRWQRLKGACDLWCTAFFTPLKPKAPIPTTRVVWDRLTGATGSDQGPLAAAANTVAEENRFFHWQLEFPEVFMAGGFDVALGNPPWDTLSPDVKEFFAPYDPQVRFASPEEQRAIVDRLLRREIVSAAWTAYSDALYRSVKFMKWSGRYRLFAPGNLGKGDFNIYRMFVELALAATRPAGRTSQLVPENFYNGANAAAIRGHIFESTTLERLLCFENRRRVWFDVHAAQKFAIYCLRKTDRTEDFAAAFRITSNEALAAAENNALKIPLTVIREFSPDAAAVMEFSNQFEIDITRKMYARFPKFGEEIRDAPYRHYMREVDMGNERGLFDEDPSGLPVYEGRMVAAYDYRAKGYMSGRGRKADWVDLPFGEPSKAIRPQWYIPQARLPAKLGRRPYTYRTGFCDVASPTNERSLVAAMVPPHTVCGDKVPTISFAEGYRSYYSFAWLGMANSLAVDFLSKAKVALKMSYTLVDSLPFWRSSNRDPAVDQIAWRAASLSCAGTEMVALWEAVRNESWLPAAAAPVEQPEERARMQAEIDALVAYLYGLTRDELRYIIYPPDVLGPDSSTEIFKRLRLNEEREFKEYRTHRLVLEAYDRFAKDGTFDPARLQDARYFETVKTALTTTKAQLSELERTYRDLVARTDADRRPTLFVEGTTDAAIIAAAWKALFPGAPQPFQVLAAEGTKNMGSLAGKGKALREILGNRLVFALADNDFEGRSLWDNKAFREGGQWRQHENGIWWCALKPTYDFRALMSALKVDPGFWPFSIEACFSPALRRQAKAAGAWWFSDDVQSDLVRETGLAKRMVKAVRGLSEDDDAAYYLLAPHYQAKDAFAAWVTTPERLTPANYAAFAPILTELKALIEKHALPAA